MRDLSTEEADWADRRRSDGSAEHSRLTADIQRSGKAGGTFDANPGVEADRPGTEIEMHTWLDDSPGTERDVVGSDPVYTGGRGVCRKEVFDILADALVVRRDQIPRVAQDAAVEIETLTRVGLRFRISEP